jgi:hypothetical protein
MYNTRREYERVIALREAGETFSGIARVVGVARSTARSWVRGAPA